MPSHSPLYAQVREQFNVPLSAFEGIQEALARIGGNAWLMDSARMLTVCRNQCQADAQVFLVAQQVVGVMSLEGQAQQGRDRAEGDRGQAPCLSCAAVELRGLRPHLFFLFPSLVRNPI